MRTTAHTRRTRVAGLVIVVAGAIACGDQVLPSAPTASRVPAPSFERGVDGRVRASILRRWSPLRFDEVACRVVDPAHMRHEATIALEQAGLRVTFPLQSVSARTRICLTAEAGTLLTYTFEPHGLQFNLPIRVQQDLRGTTAFHNPTLGMGIVAGYLLNGVAADVDSGGVGRFEETFATSVSDEGHSPNRTSPAYASFSTWHFSGYALASGKAVADSITTAR